MKQYAQNILQSQVPLVPQLFILGLYRDNLKIKSNQRIFVDLSILMAKRVIAPHFDCSSYVMVFLWYVVLLCWENNKKNIGGGKKNTFGNMFSYPSVKC